MPSSLLTFSTKAKLQTATAFDHRASRTDNSSRRAIGGVARSEFDRASPLETFASLPTALRLSQPLKQWVFHQAQKTLTFVSVS
jgi:hypothetical protein